MTSTTWKKFTVQGSTVGSEAATQELLSQAINLYLKEMETKGLTLLSAHGLTEELKGATLEVSLRFFWTGNRSASSESSLETLPSQRSSAASTTVNKASDTSGNKTTGKSSVLPEPQKLISPSTIRKSRSRRSSFSDQRTIVPEFLMEPVATPSSSGLSNTAHTEAAAALEDMETEEGLGADDLLPPPFAKVEKPNLDVQVEIEESPLLTDEFANEDFGMSVEDLDQGRFMNKLDFSSHSVPSAEINEPMKTEEKRKNNESVVFLDDPDM